jgi:hypothetical protein
MGSAIHSAATARLLTQALELLMTVGLAVGTIDTMGDRSTFEVDVAALGALPQAVDDARQICASIDVDGHFEGAATATGSSSGALGMSDLCAAMGRFVRAGAGALQSDSDRLRSSANSYANTERAINESLAGGSR